MKEFGLYINGKWTPSTSKKTFPTINPAKKNQVLAQCAAGTREDVEKAVYAAEKALPAWKKMPAPRRGEVLLEVASLLKKRKQKLGELVTTEMGKVLKEGLGDVQEAIDIFEYMAGEGRRLFGHTTPSELKNKFCCTIRQPIGVVGLITPWNFPFAIPAWKLAPALICGNTIVFKPSSDTPLCAIELIKILEEAGIPPGVVNMVTGSGEDVGTSIITHKRIQGLSFTGSRETGEFIARQSGLKKVGLELGGKNAIIIMDDADLDLALEGVLWGAFGTTGQRCTACSRVIIHKNVQKEFEEKLLARVKKLKLGSGLDPKTDVGPLIAHRAILKTHMYTEIGKKEGAKLLCGGYSVKSSGFFYAPTIFTNVKPHMRIAREEIFGPTLSILKANDLKEAIQICNSIEYGLSSSMYTQNINNAFRAIERIEAGITYVNASTIGAEVHLPFGGVKATGNGTREAGWTGIEEFSEEKTIYIDYSGKLQKAQIDIEE
ncbi:aldehyde dehydrogenase family protein [Candidatus Woesearchaeota archaeon]|nr:aldehyde dehydrogenase family protein [Candidatus Woesearchaeota archaeon]